MRFKNFGDFIDKKQRDAMKQLKLIEQVLTKHGFQVDDFMTEGHEDDPYIFVSNPNKNTSFDGVRIYKIGDIIAFRIQKESETHPYGNAYTLAVEKMFDDLMSEDEMDEIKAGKLVMKAIAKELHSFFDKSEQAEDESRAGEIDMSNDNVMVRSTNSDYSSQIYSKV
jgi:hypothetical protein